MASDRISVVTWNVLAAPWAAPAFYPPDLDAALLERGARAHLVGTLLASLDVDVMCLQETTPPDLGVVLECLGPGIRSARRGERPGPLVGMVVAGAPVGAERHRDRVASRCVD